MAPIKWCWSADRKYEFAWAGSPNHEVEANWVFLVHFFSTFAGESRSQGGNVWGLVMSYNCWSPKPTSDQHHIYGWTDRKNTLITIYIQIPSWLILGLTWCRLFSKIGWHPRCLQDIFYQICRTFGIFPPHTPEEGAKGLYYSIVLLASQTSSNTIPYPPSPQDWAKQQGGIARGLCVHCYNLYGRAEGARTVNRVGRIWISWCSVK